MREKTNKKDLFIRGCIAAVFSIPVITTPSLIYASHAGKWLWVAGVILVGVLYSIVRYYQGGASQIRFSKSLYALLAYISVVLAWSFVGDTRVGLWGDALRLSGAWVWVVMGVLALWLAWWVDTHQKKLFVLRIQSLAAIITVSLAFLTQFSPDFFDIPIGVEGIGGRLVGLWGSSTYIAMYLMTSLLLMFLHAVSESHKKIRYTVWAGSAVVYYGLLQTGTRAAQVGLVVAVVMALGIYIKSKSEKNSRIVKRVAAGLAVLSMVAVYVLAFTPPEQQSERFYHPIYWTEKIGYASSISSRLLLWTSALDGIAEKPLMGWGHEMYERVFDLNYQAQIASYGLQETWAERAHNQLLETTATMGIVGLLAYVLLILSPLFGPRSRNKSQLYMDMTLAGVLGAYMGAGLFSFNTPSQLLHLALIIGLSAGMYGRKLNARNIRISEQSIKILSSLLILLALFMLVIRPYAEAKEVYAAQDGLVNGNIDEYERRLTNALKFKTYVMTDTLKIMTDDLVNNNNGTIPSEYFQRAIPLLLEGYESYNARYEPRYAMALREAQLHALAVEHIDAEKHTAEAYAGFDHARSLSAGRQTVDVSEMQLRLQLGDTENARQLIDRLVEGVPSSVEFKWTQVVIMASQGETKAAGEKAAVLIREDKFFKNPSAESLEMVLLILEEAGDYDAIFLQLRNTIIHGNGPAYLNTGYNQLRMAYAAYNLGGLQAAQSAAIAALELDPTLEPQVRELITRITEQSQ